MFEIQRQKKFRLFKKKEYKIDRTAPTGEIKIKENSFTSFWNTITFGMFFKDKVDVTITGADTLSGVASVAYIKAATNMDQKALEEAVWSNGDEFSVSPNEKFFTYAKITDYAGNFTVINSEGVVVYTDSDQDTQNIVFTKTSTTDVQADVKTNGNTINKIMNGDTLLDSQEDYSVSNSTITFKARYLDTLSAGDYNLSVYYNPMGVTYAEATDNEAPKTTSMTLTVNKEEQTISNVTEMTKTYGEAPIQNHPNSA